MHYSLNKNGFYVNIARTVEEAEKYLCEIGKYDLLILDVTLPDGTGFDVCENVRKQNEQIPIIFLTASDEEVNIIRGLDCGGDCVLLLSAAEVVFHLPSDTYVSAAAGADNHTLAGNNSQHTECDI